MADFYHKEVLNHIHSGDELSEARITRMNILLMVFLAVIAITGAVFVLPEGIYKIIAVIFLCLFLALWVLTSSQITLAQKHKMLWYDVKKAFRQADVEHSLSEASNQFFDSASKELELRNLIPADEDSSLYAKARENLDAAKNEVRDAKERFWLLYGLFTSLDFKMKENIGDYSTRQRTRT